MKAIPVENDGAASLFTYLQFLIEALQSGSQSRVVFLHGVEEGGQGRKGLIRTGSGRMEKEEPGMIDVMTKGNSAVP